MELELKLVLDSNHVEVAEEERVLQMVIRQMFREQKLVKLVMMNEPIAAGFVVVEVMRPSFRIQKTLMKEEEKMT